MVWRCTVRSRPRTIMRKRLLFQIGLLHQPVRQPPQQVDMRSAALVAARPQPDVVGQEERDAAFAFARKQQQRLVVGPLHDGCAFGGAGVDEAEPAAPMRRILIGAFEAARHRMALAEIGQLRAEGTVGGAAARLGRQDDVERRAPDAGRAGIVGSGRHQHRAALAHIARDIVEIDDRQAPLAARSGRR